MPPFLLQRLVRLLPIEENLRKLHDGDEAGTRITIGRLVLFGVHKLNADGEYGVVREEIRRAFAQVCV